MHSCPLSDKYEQFLLKHIFKIQIFRVQNTFEPNVLKWGMKIIFINSSPFDLLVINVKISSIFKKNGADLVKKKCLKKTWTKIHS
jgi:hypothetical protein